MIFGSRDRKQLTDPVHASDPIRPRLAVLWTALVASIAMLAAESMISGPVLATPYRTAALLVTAALAAYELIGDKRTEVILVGVAVIFPVLFSRGTSDRRVDELFRSGRLWHC